eukprot:403374095
MSNSVPNLKSRLIPKNIFVDHNLNSGVDLVELKLPSCLRIQSVAYDPSSYQVEDPIVYTNDKGIVQEKVCAVEDIIRWRYVEDEDNQSQFGKDITIPQLDKKLEIDQSDHRRIESNAKFVQWSDGTYSLAIGDEFFEINMENLTNRQCYSQFEKFLLYKGDVNKKMIVKPPPKSTKNQKRFIKRINEAQSQIQQANITVAGNDKKYESVRNMKGVKINTTYQEERADTDTYFQGPGAKRTLDQAKADLEDDEYYGNGSNNLNKRQRTGPTTEVRKASGTIQSSQHQDPLDNNGVVLQQTQLENNGDNESGEEEIYQSRQQMEFKQTEIEEKESSDSDSSDSDSSDEAGDV